MKPRDLNRKAQIGNSFGWIFAIIIGAVILFLTIFGISKFAEVQKLQQSAETSKEIDVLLNPLETGFETGQKVRITAPVETRIYATCDLQGDFGRQIIRTQQKSFNEWSAGDIDIVSRNKYIFADNPVEGENFYAFSKPFRFDTEFPSDSSLKVSDLIYLISLDRNYCFMNPPSDIRNEISDLDLENVFLSNCPSESEMVCFSTNSGEDCDVEVNVNGGFLEKDSEVLYFVTDSLMYAAIFSDKDDYECQVKRVMLRASKLNEIYLGKNQIESSQSCRTDLEGDLIVFGSILDSYGDSRDIESVNDEAKYINRVNSNEGVCKLW